MTKYLDQDGLEHLLEGLKVKSESNFSGTQEQVILGDGTKKSIEELLRENIEIIREALEVATQLKNGLMPQLPEEPRE